MTAYSSLSDLQLADLLKNDDEIAFAEIYKRHAGSLAGFASSKLYNLDDARDIIHDLFLKFWEERQSVQITSSLKAYLFTLTRYRIIDKIRRNITREEYAAMLQALEISYDPGVEQQLAAKELQETINRSLDALAPRAREIYRLSREDHMSTAEIAGKLQLSEQTVKNQLTSALKHLRQSLAAASIPVFIAWLIS